MKLIKTILLLLSVICLSNCKKSSPETNVSQEIKVEQHTDAAGFNYETVTNDPTGLRLYTLENGLKVYLAKNEEEPKIQTFIAVRAGSNYDPKEATGLAHYLEHMVFKGTDEIGTQDFEKEKVLLQQISDLYEQHKVETDADKKKEIYKKIDEISFEASKISISNEYDKMISSLGAEGTNAHTWFEETVYKNKIPANELDKWLTVESERFSQLVLRLFHTELEAVYEEFNRGQDNDGWKSYAAMLEGLFPNHPYGQQKTIGTSEHLKNPSMVAIHNYFDKYYVPNNMAMVLVGDIDFDQTIQKVNKAFGGFEKKEVVHPVLPKEDPITSPVIKEVFGPTAESVSIAFRSAAIGTKEEKLLTLADMLLANGNAGLIDLNLNQKQVVQNAGCSPTFLNDYGYHQFYGSPKAEQTLDEVKDLLLSQIDKLKKGEFEDWMISAVVNDLKLSQTREYENNSALASAYYNAFIHREDWKDKVEFLNELKKVSKQELVDFANSFYKDNYVVIYKRKGEDKNITKVENPGITPVELNRDKQSEFIKAFAQQETPPLTPKFIDYKSAIKETKTDSELKVSYIDNPNNDLFNLSIIFDMGRDNDRKVSLATGYLDYLGTDKYSPEELKKEFYKLGIDYYVNAGSDKTYVGISGLKENLDAGLALLEHLWTNAVPNQETYAKYVDQIAKGRQDAKTQKGNILWNGLMNYGMYGDNSPLRNIYTIGELQAVNPQELVDKIKELRNFKQRIFYYGKDIDAAIASINKNHKVQNELLDYPEEVKYVEKETGGNVYFVDYDMVQSEMIFLAKGSEFDPDKMAASRLFNTYFGSGLSSIVFQEIRESKSLAYSAFSAYSTASEKGDSNYVYAYIGTQANKMPQAVDAMMDLMTNMPEAEEQFNAAKEATLKKIAAQRITKSNIFWTYEGLKKRGIDNDNREEMYNTIKDMTLDDLKSFFNENIKGETYNVLVVGNKKDVNMDALSKLGVVKEMDIDYLFNYEKKNEDIKL
ncbi:putative Zn-dependent peptidase [Aquimarina sp. EL_43]|uniref:M16 family metallopeptidase n=1 Tax=unclassified Aquimarina TaxID=2627091 RepID=UPI0018CBDC45|nr:MULTISPECIES: M16 family metallopeptidase [unclassified Aquimarina]MBG6129763.1 putative Zn-dependent peptidase [Aquimarina sp. EL_35]MBG6150828.1 putative Zn-dependent peptidase [Aquimarina sp. EL_32]MBG6167865.1 putative Zn-dependent peptidase [Aquimarina sp. EL_43]